MVRQAMEDGVDVIVFSAVDYNANAEIISQAAQRGIKIVVIDSDVNSSMVSCRIGTNNLQAGVRRRKQLWRWRRRTVYRYREL